MKGDFSKDTFRKKKHFHDVHMQQGRVLLDSDWNEQADIYEHRIETGTSDIVGKAGAPYHDAGFDIVTVDNAGNAVIPPVTATNIKISEGRFYVDGIMCENDATVLFVNQPDYDKTALPTVPGKYLFYLDVWQRHITALEDSDLREVALGGPDTTTRNKTVWQVKFVKPDVPFTCFDKLPDFITNAPSGKLMARTELPTGTEDPCGLAVSGGYRRLENQLYRVEIHKGAANRAGTTFKWSRDNGSVVVKWESVEASDTNNLVVSSVGRDELLGFKSGDWIEMIDDKTDLLGLTGPLVQVSKVEGNVITINPATNIPGETPVSAGAKNSRIRRWDSVGALKPNTNNTDWIELEDGVQVQFKEGSFRTGDYWLIPARTATADIEWPFIDHQSPNGVQHHYAKLGIAELVIGAAPGWVKISDCRQIFPPLTELITLNYVGGDGQEAVPGAFLDEKLKVAVSNGQWPVKNAKVKFKIDSGGGTLEPANVSTVTLLTNADGIAECQWKLGLAKVPLENQRVKVTLLDAGDNPIHLPVIFNAKLTPPALFYVSGDGQQANLPGLDLPADLKVGVAYEQFPVTGAKVKFTIESGGGSILPASASTTGIITAADGLASCKWKLGNSGLQQVKATLLDASNNPVHIPIIFNASLIVAGNVAYNGGDCNNWLTPKPNNVADALTALCKRTNGNSCSTYTVSPGDNVQAVFDQIPPGQDAHVCFQAGVYPLAASVLVSNKGNLKVSGCGPGTKLIAANSEAALVFDKCKTVIVRDLYAETGKTGENASDLTKHLNGTLVFLGSSAVQIESVNLKCGYGPRKAATCITVRNDNTELACSVNIRDCKLKVGYFQEGILLVNATRATVENNELSVYNRPLQMNFQSMLKDRYFRAGVRSYFAKNAPAEITPGRRSARAAVNDLPVAAAAGAGATLVSNKEVWAKLLGAKKVTQFRNTKTYIAHVEKTIDRYLKNESLRAQSVEFNTRFNALAEQSQVGIGTQGITVGGTVAKDIRIFNNTIHGFLQGIHIGLSHRRVRNVERTDDIAEVITIAGNTIGVILPPYTGKTERYGIFVGNCQDLIIENNTVTLERMAGANELRVNGIEIWGVFGQRLMVTKNMVRSADAVINMVSDVGAVKFSSFDIGIFIKLLKTTWSVSQFAVLWNVVPSKVQGVVADPEVIILQNNKG